MLPFEGRFVERQVGNGSGIDAKGANGTRGIGVDLNRRFWCWGAKNHKEVWSSK